MSKSNVLSSVSYVHSGKVEKSEDILANLYVQRSSDKADVFFPWEIHYLEFSIFLEGRGLSKRTKRDYHKHLHLFFERYPSAVNSFRSLQQCVFRHLGDEIKPSTYNLRRQYLLSFFKWCVEKGYLLENPLKGIKKKGWIHRDIVIEQARITKLLSLINVNTFAGSRDLAIILLTMDTGIRPSEALQLMQGDIIRGKNEKSVQVRQYIAKSRKARCMPFSDQTLQAIMAFEKKRRLLHVCDDVPFFCTQKGKGFGEYGWSSRLKWYCKKCGFKIAPYDLRHYFAVLYLRNGGREEPLRRILGHEDERTLRWYMNLALSDVQNDHVKASPVLNLLSA